MAAITSSIGLGNVWKFPYELGLHGGTFLYVYIACVILVALPLMIAELLIGRVGRANPVKSVHSIVVQEKKSSLWASIGWLGILTSFLIFSFYSVVASWSLFYVMQSLTGTFINAPAEIVQNSFGALLRNTDQQTIWHSIYVLMVVLVLSQGVRSGLERAVRVLIPLFIALLIWLAFYAYEVGDFRQAYEFMSTFDISSLTPQLFVAALTQALFSSSVGIGILIMYGSYLNESRPLIFGAGTIVVVDTSIALLMAFTILSIVFAFGLQVDSGPGLIFETLPVAFSQIHTNGIWWSSSFFFLLFVAALTSGFALLEPTIAIISSRLSLSRRAAAWLSGTVAWALGWLSVYSFNESSFSFYYFNQELHHGYFDFINILSTHVLLPFTVLLICIFVGWRMSRSTTIGALNIRFKLAYLTWRFCIRFVAPIIIAVALVLVLFYPA